MSLTYRNTIFIFTFFRFLIKLQFSSSSFTCSSSVQTKSIFTENARNYSSANFMTIPRRERTHINYKLALIKWQPQFIMSSPECFDIARASLEMKSSKNPNEWIFQVSENGAKAFGMFSQWVVPIEPCFEHIFRIRIKSFEDGVTDALYTIATAVGPATRIEIIKAGYVPGASTLFEAEMAETSAKLYWSKSACAAGYEIMYGELGGSDEYKLITMNGTDSVQVRLTELKPCTRYEFILNSILGHIYSPDNKKVFVTKPKSDVGRNINAKITPGNTDATISWNTWQGVSCIIEYNVQLCKAENNECNPTMTVSKSDAMPSMRHRFVGLQSCTKYTVEIQPLYDAIDHVDMNKIKFKFKTKSPNAAQTSVGTVVSESISAGRIRIFWPKLKCASGYTIFYRQESEVGKWHEAINDLVTKEVITLSQLKPCTSYVFAVNGVLDGAKTGLSVGEPITSDLDESYPFQPTDLRIHNGDKSANISWSHAECISSYKLSICQSQLNIKQDCIKKIVTSKSKVVNISVSIDGLLPCTAYMLKIAPEMKNKFFTARPTSFTTTNGKLLPPSNFDVVLTPDKRSSHVSWSAVQCFTNFKVYIIRGNDLNVEANKVIIENGQLEIIFKNLTSCETYNYRVSTLVDDKESAGTNWKTVIIPPLFQVKPKLRILKTQFNNVTLSFEPDSANSKCKPKLFQFSYSTNGGWNYETVEINAASSKINLAFSGASGPMVVVKGRVMYQGTENWSQEGSSHPLDALGHLIGVEPKGYELGIAVTISVLLLVAIIWVVVILLVKKYQCNRNRSGGIDSEKIASNETSEKTRQGGASQGRHNVVEETMKLNCPDTN